MKNKALLYVSLAIISIIALLIFIRLFSERQLDDVTPGIPCDEELLKKADAYYIIPLFEGVSISENSSWCAYIQGYNKSLRLHGVYHEYNEFKSEKSGGYLEEGIASFEACFNQTPTRFKAPQEAITFHNIKIIEETNLNFDWYANAVFHKVYHCNDSGVFSNRFIDFF